MSTMLAMHMANELLSLPVAAATLGAGAIAIIVAAAMARRRLDPARLPLMGVMGAFVFAAQMINFTIPGMPGTSGHLGGGVLLAILLGPWAALVTMAAILIVQCLMFQDGGLLALGCNLINMGVIPCILGLGVYRLALGRAQGASALRQYLAAWAASMIGVTGGAALVPLEAGLSGVLQIPIGGFLGVMLGVHLLIGCIEGLITFAVIAYLRRARPATLGLLAPAPDAPDRRPSRAIAATLLVTAMLLAGVVSWFASTAPDGLEWSLTSHNYGQAGVKAVDNPSPAVEAVDAAQARYTLLPDYDKRPAPLGQVAAPAAKAEHWPNVSGWGSLAGLVGTALTLVALYLVARLLRRREATIRS